MTLTFDPKSDNSPIVMLLTAAAAASPYSSVIRRDQFGLNTFQVINTAGATVKLYVSVLQDLDSASENWQQIGADITTSAIVVLDPGLYPYVRVERDNATGGTVTVAIQSGWGVNR
jgi:hypothetical protein